MKIYFLPMLLSLFFLGACDKNDEMCIRDRLPFRKVSQEFLKSFESYLRGRNCSWNTVSTYMRTLRAVYNLSLIHIYAG